MVTFNSPPALRGTETQQLIQMRSFLFQLTDQLNRALNSLDETNFAEGTEAKQIVSGKGKAQEDANNTYNNLKSLIIKTADTVESEIEILEQELTSRYVAQSDFGAYTEAIDTRITETAADITMALEYYASITDELNSVSQNFDAYVVQTEGYIKQGIVGYDGATPIIGIAIGQEVTTTGGTETVDGVEYDVIDTTKNMSILTTKKLSFYVNGVEIAYFSSGVLHVNNIEVEGAISMQGEWEISHPPGWFVLKWTGG